eukprot:tig00020964_g16782.t1
MAAESPQRQIVVDANAVIKGIKLERLNAKLVTVSEVLGEVRDKEARGQLALLPVDVQTREPSEDAMKAVVAFAKKTGDFPILSMTDLRLLALLYTLEREMHGSVEHLRTEPRPPPKYNLDDPAEKGARAGGAAPMPGWGDGGGDNWDDGKEEAQAGGEAAGHEEGEEEEGEDEEEAEAEASGAGASSSDPAPAPATAPAEGEAKEGEAEGAKEGEGEAAAAEDDDDEGGWITPDNIRGTWGGTNPWLPGGAGRVSELDAGLKVACITSDYAMQNVILQMGMKLVSFDGLQVTDLKRFVLRCHACWKVTNQMERKFCEKCGNSTLVRVSMRVASDGSVLYYNSRRPYNLRGTKFPLPLPKGGRNAADPILCEDELRMRKHLLRGRKRDGTDPLASYDEKYLAGLDGRRTAPGGPNVMIGGPGKRNPNEVRRTGRRKK